MKWVNLKLSKTMNGNTFLLMNPKLLMPGVCQGKIAFYTGILDITENEDGMASVMGHEIAHAVAKHS